MCNDEGKCEENVDGGKVRRSKINARMGEIRGELRDENRYQMKAELEKIV